MLHRTFGRVSVVVGILAACASACGQSADHAANVGDILFDAGPEFDPNDTDHDGYTPDQGDCNDTDPKVNPGAFEYVGNDVDDDCNGQIDDGYADCDKGLVDATDPKNAAFAMNICPEKFIVKAQYLSKTKPEQRAIRTDFGPNIVPIFGSTLLALSSGRTLVPAEAGFQPTQPGTDMGFTDLRPAAYANNPACPTIGDTPVHDVADLELTLKAPTNAQAFSFNVRYFSAEYPDYYCSNFNDAFAAVLTSKKLKGVNISKGAQGEFLSVNVSFWSICTNTSGGASGKAYSGCTTTPSAVDGTGFGTEASAASGEPGHGATAWLTTTAPIEPGETFKLRLAVWDEGDGILDSTVLLDNFTWDIHPTDGPSTVVDNPK